MSLPTRTSSTLRKAATPSRTKGSKYVVSQQKWRHRQNQCRVRFSNTVTVTEVPSHRLYTCNERLTVWYTKLEYRCFILEESIRKKQLGLLDNNGSHDDRCKVLYAQNSKNSIGDKQKSEVILNKFDLSSNEVRIKPTSSSTPIPDPNSLVARGAWHANHQKTTFDSNHRFYKPPLQWTLAPFPKQYVCKNSWWYRRCRTTTFGTKQRRQAHN